MDLCEEDRKKKRKSYRAQFKREVILYSDVHGNRQAGLKFGVDESCVRDWRKKRLVLFKCNRDKRAFRGRKTGLYPGLEVELAAYVRQRRKDALLVTAQHITTKANELARARNISRLDFKASRGWVDKFMRRQGFSLRRRTSICQKQPVDFEDKLVAYQRHVLALRKETEFLLRQIGNADETPIWFDLPANYTIHDKGDKQVVLKTTGGEKQRVTVMLAVTADGQKLPPFLIFKRKLVPKPKNGQSFPPGVLVRAQSKGWMTEELMVDWLKNVWGKRPGALLQVPSMLVLDAFRGHLTAAVKKQIQELKSKLVVIPGGMTSVLQPLDVSINKPFKALVRERYTKWLARDDLPRTHTGNIKKASPFVLAGWVKADAWDELSPEVVSKSFRKCGLSNALDGTEDDDLWRQDDDVDEDGEDDNSDEADDSDSASEASDDSEEDNE